MTADTRRLAVRLDRLASNVRHYRAAARGLIARVDHDGFGLGLVPVARECAAAGADILAVADFDEAARLREAGIRTPLLALRVEGAVMAGQDVCAAVDTPGEAETAVRRGAAGVHVVLDCGDAVRGIPCDDTDGFDRIAGIAHVVALMGVADTSISSTTASATFETARATLASDLPRHLHGTRGVNAGCGADDDFVRVGRGLYGIAQSDGTATGLPVARLTGQVITVKRISAGEGVSYGYIYRAPADGTIALVSGGYADGVPRGIGNHVRVLVNGHAARVIGRVAMDVVVVELGNIEARAGDEIVFLGDPASGEPSVADWASITGLDPVEVAASIGPRVARSYTR